MPTEFSLAGITFRIYGLLIGIAIIVVLKIAEFHLDQSEQKRNTFWDAAVVMLVGALIGARLWHVMTDWHLYQSAVVEVLYVWRGGLSIIGALLGIWAGAYVATKYLYKNLKLFELTDSLVLGLPFGQALGRLGNWFNQELYGLPTNLPWKIYIEPDNRISGYQQFEYYHPLFLYEAVLLVMSGGLLLWMVKRQQKFSVGQGLLTVWYLVLYGWIRFFLEFLRIDKAVIDGMLGVNQIVMLFVAIGATVYLARKLHKGNK